MTDDDKASATLDATSQKNSPIRDHAQSILRFAYTLYHAKDMQRMFAKESQGMFYGPMPVKEFFDRFLPVGQEVPPRSVKSADFSKVPDYDAKGSVLERAMYKPLVKAMNMHSKPFQLVISASDSGEEIKIRPDIGMVDPTRVIKPRPSTAPVTRAMAAGAQAILPPPVLPLAGSFAWSRCELSCEVKRSVDSDAFDDDDINMSLDRLTARGSLTRGQLITYYKEQASRQHRTFMFQIFIFGSFARFLRWDRSGAVVTRRFNYKEEPRLLAGFLWRYGRLSLPDRGWDTNFALADAVDVDTFQQEVERVRQEEPPETASGRSKTIYKALQAMKIEDILDDNYPTYTVRISPSTNWNYATKLIIRRPLYEPFSPFGRATRGYLAYDTNDNEFRFFKDIWRIDHRYLVPDPSDDDGQGEPIKQYRSEDEFYTFVKGLDIPQSGLPKVYFAGDVKNEDGSIQKTQTNELPRDDPDVNTWRKICLPLRAHVHQHVLQELLCPLQLFKNSRELFCIIHDVLKTMKAVKEKARILHRDISAGNVMFRIGDDNKIQGVLNDWDNNGPVQDEESIKRKAGLFRTGTWQFMSVDLLKRPDARHEFRHDVESVVLWVPLYMILRYLKHNDLDKRVTNTGMFDASLIELPNNAPNAMVHFNRGGVLKDKFITDPATQLQLESKPLNYYLGRVIETFCEYYTLVSRTSKTLNPKVRAARTRKIAASINELNDPDYFLELFDEDEFNPEADWPEDDKTKDQFPPKTQAEQDMEYSESGELVVAHSDQHARYGVLPMVAPPAQRPATPTVGSSSPAAGVGSSPRRGKGKSKAKQSTPIYSSSPVASSSQVVKRKRSSSDEFLPPKTNKRAKARGRR